MFSKSKVDANSAKGDDEIAKEGVDGRHSHEDGGRHDRAVLLESHSKLRASNVKSAKAFECRRRCLENGVKKKSHARERKVAIPMPIQ